MQSTASRARATGGAPAAAARRSGPRPTISAVASGRPSSRFATAPIPPCDAGLPVMQTTSTLAGRATRTLIWAATALLFVGCAQNEGRYPSFCPQVAVLDAPGTLPRFQEGSVRRQPGTLSNATLTKVQ